MKDYLWMNKETGELMTYVQAVNECSNLYDLDDTNVCGLEEYYEVTDMEVPEDWDNPELGLELEDLYDEMGYDPHEGCYIEDC